MTRVLGVILLSVVLYTLYGCGKPESSLEIKGSDTMVNLGQAFAEAYMKINPQASISVMGGGSGVGIAALINGDVDIAQSSREMKPEEMSAAKKKGMDPQEFTVAQDGVSVIVNPANRIQRLTIAQLAGIYTGEITNWKELGGSDGKIVAVSRDKSSGTHVFFLEHVVQSRDKKAQYSRSVLMLASSRAIADEVAQNPSAIGYVGMGYVEPSRHKVVAIASSPDSEYIEPTEEEVLSGRYPIARPLYFYTPEKPTGVVKSFIDFVLSDDGQKIVRAQEFVPIRIVK
ncbi:MAG: phosphate ABC transporter substrate-binding protein [Armatimonadota bacterium]